MKKQDYNVHDKKPPQSVIDDFQIPYVDQLKDKMEALKSRAPFKPDEYKPDFQKNFRVPPNFSERDFFNTVFISGDDMVKEQLELKHKGQDEWKSKVVVKNTHF